MHTARPHNRLGARCPPAHAIPTLRETVAHPMCTNSHAHSTFTWASLMPQPACTPSMHNPAPQDSCHSPTLVATHEPTRFRHTQGVGHAPNASFPGQSTLRLMPPAKCSKWRCPTGHQTTSPSITNSPTASADPSAPQPTRSPHFSRANVLTGRPPCVHAPQPCCAHAQLDSSVAPFHALQTPSPSEHTPRGESAPLRYQL